MTIGAIYLGGDRCDFSLWGPTLDQVTLEILTPETRSHPLEQDNWGYWRASLDRIPPGTCYQYRLNGETLRPDPMAHFQPEGVHGPSAVVDHGAFSWQDAAWRGIPLDESILYELHIGTFTPAGTFEAAISRLADLTALGVTSIEIMPVSQFPGQRNWGYDGAYPFAVQNSYGGPDGLKALVNAAHQAGLAVILDVVYNHFGPEGNYSRDFGPYFTEKYQTPWGGAINFDEAYSYGVRQFVIENALYWLREYHLDGLRLDAIHAIYDGGAKHILAELSDRLAQFNETATYPRYLIAESDLNDVRIIRPRSDDGLGMDAQWSDDFHHSLHTLLTGEQQGYYEDFGRCEQLATAWRDSFVYQWTYSPHRKRFHGSDARDRPPSQFVVCHQNHDQIGNRMLGERLSQLVSFDALKLAAAATLLNPGIPLLFMGEEYGEDSPFLYFIDHQDPDLVEAVRQGRKREFEAFHASGTPPDAASLETFKTSTLKWDKRQGDHHQVLLNFYKHLIERRTMNRAIIACDRQQIQTQYNNESRWFSVHQSQANQAIWAIFNFNETIIESPPAPNQTWTKTLDSSDSIWQGSGPLSPTTLNSHESIKIPPLTVVLYENS
ncbi:malto-oligosyltrehalose trehalohydrolase [Phormidium willei BDU 130791]|nr:malto-oligosyltrehalose trehalohydrolase [Phormidium willei BDU 130791]